MVALPAGTTASARLWLFAFPDGIPASSRIEEPSAVMNGSRCSRRTMSIRGLWLSLDLELDALDVLRRSVGPRVERCRTVDLDALRDLDLFAEADPSVPSEVKRKRAGRR